MICDATSMTIQNNQPLPDWKADFDKWIEEGTAKSTRRAYDRDIAYFWSWCEEYLRLEKNHYPVSPEVIIQFCLYHLNEESPRRLKVSTLRRYLASVSVGHKEASFASPTTNVQVKLLLKRVKSARIERSHQKAAITKDILDKMLATCDETLMGVRDQAILMVAFYSGGRRRSEIANLRMDDITKTKDGYLITLAKSKTDQNAEGFKTSITGQAALALKQWLIKSGIRESHVFRGIKSDCTLYPSITGTTIYNTVKKRIRMIGLDDKLYGAHSLRAGFITESVNSGKTIYETMQYSGHRDAETAQSYIRIK